MKGSATRSEEGSVVAPRASAIDGSSSGSSAIAGSLVDDVRLGSSSAASITGASEETVSPSRRRITITPCVERPRRFTSSTGILITVPPVEISITW